MRKSSFFVALCSIGLLTASSVLAEEVVDESAEDAAKDAAVAACVEALPKPDLAALKELKGKDRAAKMREAALARRQGISDCRVQAGLKALPEKALKDRSVAGKSMNAKHEIKSNQGKKEEKSKKGGEVAASSL